MSRSLSNLRRVLFGVSCAVVFGFGATQAFGSPAQARVVYCIAKGYDYQTPVCGSGCYRQIGYCDASGVCHCGYIS